MSSKRLKAEILWNLKREGDIVTGPDGQAGRVMYERISNDGVQISMSGAANARRELEGEGLVEVTYAGERQITAIKLLDVGSYVDPKSAEGKELYAVRSYTPRIAGQGVGRMSLDRILVEVSRLSVAERLMLIGQIGDACVEEIETREAKVADLLAAFN